MFQQLSKSPGYPSHPPTLTIEASGPQGAEITVRSATWSVRLVPSDAGTARLSGDLARPVLRCVSRVPIQNAKSP